MKKLKYLTFQSPHMDRISIITLNRKLYYFHYFTYILMLIGAAYFATKTRTQNSASRFFTIISDETRRNFCDLYPLGKYRIVYICIPFFLFGNLYILTFQF